MSHFVSRSELSHSHCYKIKRPVISSLRAHSHQAKAGNETKKIKEQAKEIKKINDKHQRTISFSLSLSPPKVEDKGISDLIEMKTYGHIFSCVRSLLGAVWCTQQPQISPMN